MDPDAQPTPLVLERRLGLNPTQGPAPEPPLQLALSADDRTRLRGLRQSLCGRRLLLQLPRGEALLPGEWLGTIEGGEPLVQVRAAPEALLVVRAPDSLTLLQAAYHLGNRHVALELRREELRLLQDPVLEQMLVQRGLSLERLVAPFLPEAGAYSPPGHRHGEPGEAHNHGPSPGDGHGGDHTHRPAHGHPGGIDG